MIDTYKMSIEGNHEKMHSSCLIGKVSQDRQTKNNTYSSRFNNRTEGLITFNAMLLMYIHIFIVL